jgi:hypothetical protein
MHARRERRSVGCRTRSFRSTAARSHDPDPQISGRRHSGSTDAGEPDGSEDGLMSTQHPPEAVPPNCVAYAHGLHRYAAHRLDDVSLRCWIVRRLMIDEGLDHAAAEAVFERVFEEAGRDECRRRSRTAPRVRRLTGRRIRWGVHSHRRRVPARP